MKRTLALCVMLILLVPVASAAIVLVPVTSQRQITFPFTEPIFSNTYSFQLSGTVFTEPIYHALNHVSYDFGEVKRNHVVHVTTAWNVSGTRIEYASYAQKDFFGSSSGETVVSVNGTPAWDANVCPTFGCTAFGLRFDYRQSHTILYGENQTAYVPADGSDPDFIFDGGRGPVVEIEGLTGLFYVPSGSAAKYFDPVNGSSEGVFTGTDGGSQVGGIYWLANMTHPDQWSFNTTYQDVQPLQGSLIYQFHDQTGFLEDVAQFEATDESCGGFSKLLKSIIGICPSLTGFARFAIELVPNILAFFLDFIHPNAGLAMRLVGQFAGEFVASYIFTMFLLVGSLGRTLIIAAATISGGSFIIGGLKGDPHIMVQYHILGFKYLAIGVFWYFYLYYLLARWIIRTIIDIVNTIGGYIPFT